MKELEYNLHQVEGVLCADNKAIYQTLYEPLSKGVVEEKMTGAGIESKELGELYQWNNGNLQHDIPGIYFCSWGYFLPLDTAIGLYNEPVYSSVFRDGNSFFPVIESGGDFILYNANTQDVNFGKLYIYSPALLINEPMSMFDSLISFLTVVKKCFEKKVWYVNAESEFIVDTDWEFEIAKTNNADSEYWRSEE